MHTFFSLSMLPDWLIDWLIIWYNNIVIELNQLFLFWMSDNEVNEIFAYLSKDNEIPIDKIKNIFSNVYK